MIFFTAIIAVATIVQAILAYFIYRANKIMAGANEKSAEILRLQTQLSHRPCLTVRQLILRSPESSLESHADIAVDLIVVNTGAGKCAAVSESNITVLIDDARYVPYDRGRARVPYEAGVFRALPSAIPHPFEPGAYEEVHRTIPGFKTQEQVDAFSTGNLFIYALGYFNYQDDGGRRYRTAFCRRYDRKRSAFVKVNNPDYEFTD